MKRIPFLRTGLTALWLALIGGGLHALLSYQTIPGQAGEPPGTWPAASSVQPSTGRFTLLQFLHPHCPCSRRSLDEVRWLLARSGGQLDIYLIFVVPPGAPEGWEQTELWRRASALAGVNVRLDRCGEEARLFGAKTSGHTLVFDRHCQPRFSGGLIGISGHVDDGLGRRAVLDLLTTGATSIQSTPVFGCPLLDDEGAAEATVCPKGDTTCRR